MKDETKKVFRLNEKNIFTLEDSPIEIKDLAEEINCKLNEVRYNYKKIKDFSSDLFHEIRTPLNNILGAAEVALINNQTKGAYRETVESILVEGRRLNCLSEQMLFLASCENEERIIKTKINLNDQLSIVINYFSTFTETKSIQLNCDCSRVFYIYADQILLQRALSNLIDNAIKFTPYGGSIKLVLFEEKGGLILKIKDTGIGISANALQTVFERFYREESTNSGYFGFGLGLSITKAILDLHQFKLQLKSLPKQGTEAYINFGKPK